MSAHTHYVKEKKKTESQKTPLTFRESPNMGDGSLAMLKALKIQIFVKVAIHLTKPAMD